MDKKKLKIAFIGTGGMGQCAHLKNYDRLKDECEVIALAELREDVGRKVGTRYSIPAVYTSAADLLAAEKPDALVASQPFSRHGIILEELTDAGVPIFIEKPLAASLAVGQRILSLLKKSGVPVMVGYHKRSDHATARAVKVIDELKASGEQGAMKYVRITMPPGDWIQGGFEDLITGEGTVPDLEFDPPADDMQEEVYDKYKAFVNYYIHQVNLMRYLLREPYEFTYADPGEVILAGRSESGISCAIEMAPYTTTVDWQESCLVGFEKGYVKLDLPAPLVINCPGRVEVLRDTGNGTPQTEIPDLPWEHAMKAQARNFLAFARGDQEAPCGPEEALEDIKMGREYIRLLTGE